MTDLSYRPRWTAADIKEILCNPFYAGVGPFDSIVEGTHAVVGRVPPLVDDDTWVKLQVLEVEEEGPRRALINIRRTLHRHLGAQVTAIARVGWLDESVRAIETEGAEAFLHRFLALLRPEDKPLQLVTSSVYTASITPEILRALATNPDEIYGINATTFEELICDRLHGMGFKVDPIVKTTNRPK